MEYDSDNIAGREIETVRQKQ